MTPGHFHQEVLREACLTGTDRHVRSEIEIVPKYIGVFHAPKQKKGPAAPLSWFHPLALLNS